MGCEIVHVYKDHGISGAKGRAASDGRSCSKVGHTRSGV
jgi:hypothetical protein